MGKQEGRGPADDLRAGVAVHPLGGRVPARDDALERVADNGITGILHDRRDELRVLDRLPLFCHVGDRRDHQQDVPGVDVGQTDVHRELGAIPVPSSQLQIQTSGPSPGVCEVVLPVLGVDLPQRLGHQRLDGPADQLVAVIAEQRFGLAIDKPDHALLVHPHQGIRHSLQQALEPRHIREHLIPLSSVAENSKQTKHKT